MNNNNYFNSNVIMNILRKEFSMTMGEDIDFFEKYNVILSNEQYYIDPEERKVPNNIYIVVKILPASLNFGQYVVPFSITAVSEHNKINACQKLLMDFAQIFNLKTGMTDEGYWYNQTYTLPQVMSNFSEIYYGYRNLFTLSGNIIISPNALPCELYYKNSQNEYEIVDMITFVEDLNLSLDTQPMSNNHNFTSSVVRYGTHTFNISTYLVNNEICKLALKIKRKSANVNNSFVFKIVYKGENIENVNAETFKLCNFKVQQNVGEIPVASMVFTN